MCFSRKAELTLALETAITQMRLSHVTVLLLSFMCQHNIVQHRDSPVAILL